MLSQDTENIFALSTPKGKGAIHILRLSGESVESVLPYLVPNTKKIILNPRTQNYSKILVNDKTLDYGLVTYFEKGSSYTGESCIEFSLHASPYIIKEISEFLTKLGVRPALAGEFTKRAYLNGKLDLSQAEAVSDLINAETKVQADASRSQLEGRLGKAIDKVGEPLRDLLSEIEANIDFPEEEIDPSKPDQWLAISDKVLKEIETFIKSYNLGKIVQDGALVVLAGIPNAGKSSLMNALLREDRAIVTDIPGTTRDSIEERIEIDGFLCRLVDTAGLALHTKNERNVDAVEKIGIERSYSFIEKADVILFLLDRTQSLEPQYEELKKIHTNKQRVLIVKTKNDLAGEILLPDEFKDLDQIDISTQDEESILGLIKTISQKHLHNFDSYPVVFTNIRHKDCLEKAQVNLQAFQYLIKQSAHFELVSFELRSCLSALSEIIGTTDTEDILGRIFSKFCIGK